MAQTEREASRIGEVVDRQFRLDAMLGEGGMGQAYLAEQLSMERRAVVKLLHAHLVHADPQFRDRFVREAKVVARLNHPNIVQIYACGETDDGVPYLALEYADGVTLKRELSQHGPLSEARVLHVGQQICRALGEAHRLGIVHRDLKPENIMLVQRHGDPDVVKLLDFGIATLGSSAASTRLTKSGMVFGTPQYMAPEQVRAAAVDARTDLYALGLVLYELLAGAPAVAGDSEFDVLTRQVTEAPPLLASLGVAVSPRLEQAIMGCLEKAPEQRWANAADLGAALAAAAHELSASSRAAANSDSRPSARPLLASGPRPIPFEPHRPTAPSPPPRAPKPAAQGGRLRAGQDDDVEEAEPSEPSANEPAAQYPQYTNYYDKLPLPRALKPYAPWVVSLVYMLLIMSFSFVMQWCNTHTSR
jgi:serine/threonine protein kinase